MTVVSMVVAMTGKGLLILMHIHIKGHINLMHLKVWMTFLGWLALIDDNKVFPCPCLVIFMAF